MLDLCMGYYKYFRRAVFGAPDISKRSTLRFNLHPILLSVDSHFTDVYVCHIEFSFIFYLLPISVLFMFIGVVVYGVNSQQVSWSYGAIIMATIFSTVALVMTLWQMKVARVWI